MKKQAAIATLQKMTDKQTELNVGQDAQNGIDLRKLQAKFEKDLANLEADQLQLESYLIEQRPVSDRKEAMNNEISSL